MESSIQVICTFGEADVAIRRTRIQQWQDFTRQ
jgi:hypothetical protein